ncbi:MAG: orotidine-5'-phosphate decarboxylase [Firmicutes bacterium]|nr:orotidine-5'-phosphate decarboxylase [Bacillota bacterium]
MKDQERLIVALDVDSLEEAKKIARRLQPHVGAFKIGMQLFTAHGPQVVKEIQQLGCRVFVDLKYHDIPNTVAQAGRVLTRLETFMFNVHAAGGREMMRQTVEAVHEEADRHGLVPPIVLAVTVLTSISDQQWKDEVGGRRGIPGQVVHWARMAQEAGLDGVVASPQEIGAIRKACGDRFVIVTPGVRPAGADLNDQQRVMTPGQAVKAGASYLVVGRPIMKASDPVRASIEIVDEIRAGLRNN